MSKKREAGFSLLIYTLATCYIILLALYNPLDVIRAYLVVGCIIAIRYFVSERDLLGTLGLLVLWLPVAIYVCVKEVLK